MSKKINIISPFGPKLAKIKLSKKVVNDINQEVERIILNKKKSKKKDYSKKLVGEVYQEIELSKNFRLIVVESESHRSLHAQALNDAGVTVPCDSIHI